VAGFGLFGEISTGSSMISPSLGVASAFAPGGSERPPARVHFAELLRTVRVVLAYDELRI
jgi:hypothetical protein